MKHLLYAGVAVLLAVGLTLALATGDAPAEHPVVLMTTSMGPIKIELYPDKSPATVKNFLGYVDDKFYDGTVFHRVMDNFMIQGGGFEKGFDKAESKRDVDAKEKKTKAPIKNEAGNGVANTTGTIAMARTPNPDSATAQFYINVVDNPNLNHRDDSPGGMGYCVFGKVVDGMDVVNKIAKVRTHTVVPRAVENVPDKDVVIESVRRVEK